MTHLFSSQKFRRAAIQGIFLAVVATLFVSTYVVGKNNIQAQGIATGFGFLEQTTGWPVSFSLIEVGPRSTYAKVLLAGLLNTMLVGFLTLFFATLLGLLLALMRISSNTPMKIVGTTYVEIFRNVPVILQVFFWYAILTHLPGNRDAYEIGNFLFLSNRGLTFPVPNLSTGDAGLLALGTIAIGLAFLATRRHARTSLRILVATFAISALFFGLLFSGLGQEDTPFSVPALKGLRFVGGVSLKPEFTALLIGLVLFGASYIGEIIRGGLISVDHGRLEAGAALGLTPFQINRFIRIPLAFRAMLPSLANQYVWLMKATTVGIAIGFPDYFAIISTSINQSGQTMELLALLMGGFIVINYSISTVMNAVNSRIKLKGRS